MGLGSILPFITSEHLKFPKLCNEYYDMLLHMCEFYPKLIFVLPTSSFNIIMNTLDYGLTHSHTIIKSVLDSLTSLMEYYCKVKKDSNIICTTMYTFILNIKILII